ncbi:DUF3019 domain-containing protein [Paraglaciecola aquimarina]|uniref:DUF3019 domain-containing protein n=1 Tax=Paraglaciecola algarum TaxID=3050085 RepID=A0ABS9D722_9ALTE|nr:DUF3019 domain-containing protein [Paraglaciecola sp. G1-23]MCF2948748.1 DUF3019 domain-containing protein [Paraglaciecola sp. G1-23]
MKISVLIISIFFCHQIAAMSAAWSIQPNICISDKVGDNCQLTINIEIENLPTGLHCLFLDDQQLSCSEQGKFLNEISITIKQNAVLMLKNKDQQTVLSQALSIKYQATFAKRRRIRNPWSIF